jgi:NAD(P)-dependent dehydrogenase (short-subunit alcohol dehydrogenase family)
MLATAGLASAYAGKGVRVVGINPGLTNTQRVAEGLKSEAKLHQITEDEALKRAVQRIPICSMAEPQEIANLALFLASPRASYVTGVIVSMDGAVSPVVV